MLVFQVGRVARSQLGRVVMDQVGRVVMDQVGRVARGQVGRQCFRWRLVLGNQFITYREFGFHNNL